MPNNDDAESGSRAAAIAVAVFGALSLLGGWLIVLESGFYHSPGKHTSDPAFYGGAPALLMALLQLLGAALAFVWILRRRLAPATAALAAFGLVFGAPLLFIVLRAWLA